MSFLLKDPPEEARGRLRRSARYVPVGCLVSQLSSKGDPGLPACSHLVDFGKEHLAIIAQADGFHDVVLGFGVSFDGGVDKGPLGVDSRATGIEENRFIKVS